MSTRAATIVEVLPAPAPILGRLTWNPSRLAPELALGSAVEDLQPFVDAQAAVTRRPVRDQPNGVAGGHPVDLVACLDAIPIGDFLGIVTCRLLVTLDMVSLL